MTGVGTDAPRDLREFVVDTRKRIVALERRQTAKAPVPYDLPDRLSPGGQEVTDWNKAIENGFYWAQSGALNSPNSSNIAAGQVTVKAEGPNPRILQEVYYPSTTVSNLTQTWRRVSSDTSGTTWYPWVDATAPYVLPTRLGPDASLLNSIDLNTLFDSGWYVQHSNTNVTMARNYPLDNRAGELEVVGNVSGTDFAMQRYTEYSNNGTGALPRVWHRTYYNTGWSGWASSAPTAKGTMSASTPPSGFEGGFTYGEADSSSFPTNFGTVEVVRKADVRAVQRLSEKTGYQRTWHRAAGDGDTWGPWVLDGGDSDWKPLTAQNGWLFATPNPSYRIRGDTCYFKGEFYAGANQTVVFNLPAEARPGSRTAVMIARFATTSTPAFGTLAINTTGDCTFNLLGGTIPTASPGITLLGVSYLLD